MAPQNDGDWAGEDRRARNNAPPRSTAFERHAQTIFGALALTSMLWVGATLIDLSKEQVRATEQIAQMRALVSSLQEQLARAVADRYTSEQARRDLASIELRMQQHEERIGRIERREGQR